MADHEVDLAELAKRNFEEQSFESCLSTVNKLCDLKKSDPKVLHNRAVAHYYLSNLTLTDDFKKVLYQVEQQMDREAEETGVEISPVDKSVLLYNQSVLLFHLRQYSEALGILERLFHIRQSLEQLLAYKVAFMCLDIYLKTYRNDCAAEIITYLDNLLFDGGRQDFSMELSTSPHPSANLYKPLMHQFRARLYLAVRQLKSAKKEIKELSQQPPPPGQGTEEPDSLPPPDTSLVPPSPALSVAAIFLKSNYEFLRGNYRKSLRLLSCSPGTPFLTDCGECLPSLYFGNLASCHAMMGKHTLAAYYFRKALEENDRALTDFPPTDRSVPLAGRPLAVLGVNRHHELVYQLGVQLLFSGKPQQAFECLLTAVQVFRTNPRIWQRLAEACVASWRLRETELVRQERNMSSTVQVLEGQGINRKLLLTPMRLQSHRPTVPPETLSVGPHPGLEFGGICVKNAIYLLNSSNRDAATGCPHSSLPGPPLSPAEWDSLLASLLATGAYVSLGLCDPVVALDYCSRLMECANLSPAISFLGSIYKAEALIILGRVEEASELLSPDSIQDSWFSEFLQEPEPPSQPLLSEGMSQPASSRVACKNDFPSTGNQARLITHLNLCSAFCLSGEFEKARACLMSASQLPLEETHPNAVLLAVYIELQTGNVANALQMIKRHQYVLASRVDRKKAKKS